MIKTPIQPFGFSSLNELKEHLDKSYYNEQPVTVVKSDLVKLVDIAIQATQNEPEAKAEEKPKKAEKKPKKSDEKKTEE